jgi:chaperonin GroEL (HSP60 family)
VTVSKASKASGRNNFRLPLIENAGEDAAAVLNAVKAGKGAYGYNAGSGEYGGMDM